MPKTLSTTIKREKNRLDASPWVLLLDITLPNDTMIYIAKNNEDVVFQGRTYKAGNFDISATEEDAKGTIPQVTLKVADMLQALEAELQAQGGGVGSTVLLRVVDVTYLAEDYAELELSFDVMNTHSKGGWVSFTLGIPSPFRKRFPLHKVRGDFCNWVRWYKGPECGYTGALATCKGTLEDCRAHNNSNRFGGHPGLSGGGFRIAY